jgi:phosphoenolpyruvate carboxylase
MPTRQSAVRDPSRAEPRSIGTAGTRDVLAREVRLLGALLGEVIVEQAGQEVFELVEATRRRAIAARRSGDDARVTFDVLPVDADTLEGVVRAFGLYFRLVNLAEARDRVRNAARRARSTGGASEGAKLRAALRRLDDPSALGRLCVSPVLTAHPTEARRRTVLVALRRVARLLARADDPRLTPAADRELRRQLREEIAVLWRTAELRRRVPRPIDEVRTAMVVFDETLYGIAPRHYRMLGAVVAGKRKPRLRDLQPPVVPPFLRFGSWIGGDRDGHPAVTADVTAETIRIHADHVLRGHEAVATRLSQTLAVKIRDPHVPPALVGRLAADADIFPDLARSLLERFPDEPFRQRLGFIAQRLRRTRARLVGQSPGSVGATTGYANAAALVAELRELQGALVEARLPRSAWGEVQDFVWQVETFGFHLANLEVRQHASVHRRALASPAGRGSAAEPPSRAEVLETFRTIGRAQAAFGPEAISRYVVSFTATPRDVTDVLDLAREAAGGAEPHLDIVPLLESSDSLTGAGTLLEGLFADAGYRAHLRGRGDRQEVMLGYSDSNKEVGYVAANWMLHQAQAALVDVAVRHDVELTLFHGRGGAIGRGGGQLELAVAAQPAGSVAGRLKLTEQGEVVWTRYGDPDLALQHLEVLTAAAIESLAPADPAAARDPAAGSATLDALAADARQAYRALVYDDLGFAAFFARITPIREISGLQLGSRPARRRVAADQQLRIDDLRAIPWVFAWSQARVELPGWYGLGTALEAIEARQGARARLAQLYEGWPFFRSLIDHARLAVDRADMTLARGYASLASIPGDSNRWARIEAEFDRTRRSLDRLPARDAPAPQRSANLRAPYVDTLSVVQLGLLRALREREARDPEEPTLPVLRSLIGLTISGLSAALQGTG